MAAWAWPASKHTSTESGENHRKTLGKQRLGTAKLQRQKSSGRQTQLHWEWRKPKENIRKTGAGHR
eukprot:3366402-Karenia_brevis.AAC.1